MKIKERVKKLAKNKVVRYFFLFVVGVIGGLFFNNLRQGKSLKEAAGNTIGDTVKPVVNAVKTVTGNAKEKEKSTMKQVKEGVAWWREPLKLGVTGVTLLFLVKVGKTKMVGMMGGYTLPVFVVNLVIVGLVWKGIDWVLPQYELKAVSWWDRFFGEETTKAGWGSWLYSWAAFLVYWGIWGVGIVGAGTCAHKDWRQFNKQ